jgi:putative 2-oxoglutarate-Fe(II)-dependent oxygenase superfamily protein
MSQELVRFNPVARIAVLRQMLLTKPESPGMLFELADALAETGQHRESARVFRQAFVRRPMTHPWPCGTEWFVERSGAAAMRDRAHSLIEQGAIFSPVIAALAMAEALLGNQEAARRLVDYERFFQCRPVRTPDGFCESTFHLLLAAEIKSELKFYGQPKNRSIRQGWRNNGVTSSPLPASAAMTRMLRDSVDRYIAGLPDDPLHPFPASRPSCYVLEGWAVVSDGASRHESHIHPRAWLSGVYYVVRPPSSVPAGSHCGRLHVGPPSCDSLLPGWESRLVDPEPGNLVLMPGYFYHHTMPMEVDEERICVAFDVVPLEISAGSTAEY